MAWNRPTERGPGTGNREQDKFPYRGLVIWAVVAFGAAVAAWFIWPSGKTQQDTASPKRTHIKEVTPAVAPTNRFSDVNNSLQVLQPRETNHTRRKAPSTAKKYPRRVIKRKPTTPSRFEHKTDDLIAHLLEVKPGAMMFGTIPFEKYENEFRQSVADPIKINVDDSEEDKQLKQAVIDARKEIARQIGDGRTFAEVMQETRQDLQRLGQYRMALEKELREIKKKDDVTDDDYQDFVKAANKMLEEKGAEPIRSSYLIYRNIELREKMESEKKENE